MIERANARYALNAFAPLAIFVLVFLSGFITTKVYQVPVPRVHDEFAYLLAADTFASGRITNPPNPEPLLLETFHVIQHPTYQGKYPPGQGFFLAIGQRVFGHPAFGIWLAMAIATAAMLRILMRYGPLWASVALSLTPLLCPPLFWQWTQSYWGGGAAYAGAALFLLGITESLQRPTRLAALAGMLGLLLLSQTRPLEGGLTAALMLLLAWVLAGKSHRAPLWKITIWMAAAGGIALTWTLFYNHTLTGNALDFPHRHWAKGVRAAGLPEQLRTYTGSKPRTDLEELLRAGRYFIGPVLIFLLPGLVLVKDRAKWIGGLLVVLLLTGISIRISAAHPHYLAPGLPLVILLIAAAWLALWQHPRTRIVAGLILALHLAVGAGSILHRIAQRPGWDRFDERQDIITKLQEKPGEHLIFVRYTPGHDVHAEYVYNAADPARAPIIWAREGTAPQRADLMRVYPDRQHWLLKADQRPNALQPYPQDGIPERE
ncbi:MAG: hypothetical protein ACI9TH_005107 [Kiritimatiellia bacterium]|jgi:hypothetical protein